MSALPSAVQYVVIGAGIHGLSTGWHLAMDLRSLLTVSEAITLAALERKESRGAHTREDYPGMDPESGKVNVVVRMGPDGEPRISREPLPQMPADLAKLFEEPAKV